MLVNLISAIAFCWNHFSIQLFVMYPSIESFYSLTRLEKRIVFRYNNELKKRIPKGKGLARSNQIKAAADEDKRQEAMLSIEEIRELRLIIQTERRRMKRGVVDMKVNSMAFNALFSEEPCKASACCQTDN